MGIAEHIRRASDAGGEHVALDLDGVTVTWRQLGEGIRELSALLDQTRLGTDARLGLLGRNRLEPVAGFIAVLGAGRGMVLINAVRPVGLIAEELKGLGLPCVLAAEEDLTPPVVAAARQAGTMAVGLSLDGGRLRFDCKSRLGAGPFASRAAGTLIEIQTSGTTGAPKRIPVSEHTIEASLRDGVRTSKGAVEQSELKPKSSPTLMFGPLVHTSGTFNTLMSVFEVRPIVLFEKFTAEHFRRALVTYRPKFVPLPPSAMKMMVDSDATKEDFSSVLAVRAGTAPLSIDLQDQFEARFGVPVLTTYGATEFMGVVTSWTLDDYKRFGKSKRGSVGRAGSGVQIRIVDPTTREPVLAGEQGLLEAKLQRIDGGREWIRTTDLGRIDEDGFLFIVGRADDAIIRGGFKVMAGKVADILRRFPGVYDAIVLGCDDERLGQVPVAVVEPYGGQQLSVEALKAFAREQMTAYEVPARFHLVERLPRTVSDKVSKPEVRKLLAELEG